jgi:hypothetical protein
LSQVTKIWYAGKDLIESKNPTEIRIAGYELLTACVKHGSSTDLERKEYFDTLTARFDPDDFHLQLAGVVELAKHGKDLSGFHYDMIPLLTKWLRLAWDAVEEARIRSKQTPSKPGQVKAPLGEETNLHQLFNFIVDVIKFSFIVSSEDETGQLIDGVIYVALHARYPEEIRDSVRVLDAIVIYSTIPSEKLPECIRVLCSIHCIILDARKDAWHTVRNLCRSHNGNTTVIILLDILRRAVGPVTQSHIREIRGSILILEKIISKAISKGEESGFPTVPFALLMDALTAVLVIDNAKVESEVLHLILSLFSGDEEKYRVDLLEEDWTTMFEIATKCSLRASETSDGRPIHSRPRTLSPAPSEASGDSAANIATTIAQTLYRFILRIERLINTPRTNDFLQKQSCIAFFSLVHSHLPETCSKLVIDYYADYRLCYPSDPDWHQNITFLLDAFFSNRSRSTEIRLQALKAVTDVYEMIELMGEYENPDSLYKFVSSILENLPEEREVAVLHHVISFAVTVADTAEPNIFEYIVKQLHQSISNDQLHSPISPPGSRIGMTGASPSSDVSEARVLQATPASIISRGIVQIFMRSMDGSSSKALRVFDEILWIAKSNSCDTDARLTVLKMLFRLRADWANRIFLTPFTESEGLASSIYRTPASLLRKQAADEAIQQNRMTRGDEQGSMRPTRNPSTAQLHTISGNASLRNVNSISRTVQRHQQLWMHPDPEALPEVTSGKASTLLVSFINENGHEDASISRDRRALKLSAWLETVMALLQQGCDWEIYSYILVYLPSQLTNQALLRGAIPQIKQLRNIICQQIKNNSFHEPPASSGLRKADVAICLFQALNMVMSYHRHFSRNEEDEIVKTFFQGMNAWDKAAKCCIHALSICCHELPNSIRTVLVSILQRMSQIITQAHVAVHILEFLACLARLPKLYSNFGEDQYRTVFGICFRYLQYVREKTQDSRSVSRTSNPASRPVSAQLESPKGLALMSAADSNLVPNASDDLPQYVYALAYHVIIFWFLSLRLAERGNQVSWIMKNLVWTDDIGKQVVDEQAQVTINFMRRTAYADVDESAADPNFTEDRFGGILKRRWIVGDSIVTVEQAIRGGWAQITKRQPSGTSHYMICEKFERPPAHQVINSPEALRESGDADPNVVQPSHLLVQLAAPMPLTGEALRPILLPPDDLMRRAITAFDRIPTVDCHKVGVIYVGENQTEETEILANVMGSSDYTDFLSELGTLTKLHGATFNTQGLDRQYNTDGEYTFCWRDRVTEMVFHVTTLMPTNLEHDPKCNNKKRHIGNDFVNIIFNNSGNPFRFDTFPSDFNYVNIVITPESRASFVATRLRSGSHADSAFYKVQVMSKQGFPEISPAAEMKIVSLKALPDFIRLLALNASVFSLVWCNRAGGEHVSSWRSRLREIVRLRDKYGSRYTGHNPPMSPAGSGHGNGMTSPDSGSRNVRDSLNSLRRSSAATFLTNNSEMNDRSSKALSMAETEVGTVSLEDSMVESLDFSKWA